MEDQNPKAGHVESRGLFDCFGKKHHEEKDEDDVEITISETVAVAAEEKEDRHTLMDELQRSHSNSSSSSDDEGEESEEKKSKKKEEAEEKINIPSGNEENAIFLDEQKQTLEMQVEKGNDVVIEVKEPEKRENSPGGEVKEKKGILEKIKEMIPGQRKSDEDETKEKDN